MPDLTKLPQMELTPGPFKNMELPKIPLSEEE
jgi:hypothetical protein